MLQEIVRSRRARIERAPGDGKYLPPLLAGEAVVISEPERSAASTTTTPSEMAEISRLRRGSPL
jgi:hypothetical protein